MLNLCQENLLSFVLEKLLKLKDKSSLLQNILYRTNLQNMNLTLNTDLSGIFFSELLNAGNTGSDVDGKSCCLSLGFKRK